MEGIFGECWRVPRRYQGELRIACCMALYRQDSVSTFLQHVVIPNCQRNRIKSIVILSPRNDADTYCRSQHKESEGDWARQLRHSYILADKLCFTQLQDTIMDTLIQHHRTTRKVLAKSSIMWIYASTPPTSGFRVYAAYTTAWKMLHGEASDLSFRDLGEVMRSDSDLSFDTLKILRLGSYTEIKNYRDRSCFCLYHNHSKDGSCTVESGV